MLHIPLSSTNINSDCLRIEINIINVAYPVIVNKYFSKNNAHNTIRKYELKSASFSAIGVPVSPGINVMTAEAAVDAAVSSITVVFFSSNDCIVFAWYSVDVVNLANTNIDSNVIISGIIIFIICFLLNCF